MKKRRYHRTAAQDRHWRAQKRKAVRLLQLFRAHKAEYRAFYALADQLAQQAPEQREIHVGAGLFTLVFGEPTRKERRMPMPRLGLLNTRHKWPSGNTIVVGVREDTLLGDFEFGESVMSDLFSADMLAPALLLLMRGKNKASA